MVSREKFRLKDIAGYIAA